MRHFGTRIICLYLFFWPCTVMLLDALFETLSSPFRRLLGSISGTTVSDTKAGDGS